MDDLIIRFQTEEESERSRRFTVHRNYLGSIELFLGTHYGYGDDQVANLVFLTAPISKSTAKRHPSEYLSVSLVPSASKTSGDV